MNEAANFLIVVAMGLNLLALGSGRLPTIIRAMSVQGVALGLMPLLIVPDLNWHVGLVVAGTVAGKGMVIPGLLRRAMRAAHIDREIEPYIGFVPSLLLGAGGTIAAVALARLLPLLPEHTGSLCVPGALASVLTGFVLMTGRVKAISQVCGYLILENGIYLFGLLLIHAMPLLVEAGILLDLTVAVFVIGIIVDRIQRAFDSLDTRKLTVLRGMKEWLLILAPLAGAALAAVWLSERTRPWLLPITGAVHLVLTLWLLVNPPLVAPDAWLGFDPLARAVLPAVSLLFMVCAIYSVSYLK